MDIRQRKHFMVLGLEMADFGLADVGAGVAAGANPISAKPQTQADYERLFGLAFPDQDPTSTIFVRQLGIILESWLRVKRINPMLKDEEIAGIRWLLLGDHPILPGSMETLLYAVAGIGPQPPTTRDRGFALNQDEADFISYKLRLTFQEVPLGHEGPDATARRKMAKEKAERLANLVFQYKVQQMEWEDSVPMVEDTRTSAEVQAGEAPKIEYYYADTKSRREEATKLVERKRTRLQMETAKLQVANAAPEDNTPVQQVAFVVEIPAGVLGNPNPAAIQVMKPNPLDPASMIKASLVGALIERVSIAHQDLEEAEHTLKRVKLDDADKKKRWRKFQELGKRVEAAFIDANAFRYGQVPSIEASKYREQIHSYDAPFKVSPQERIQYDKEKGASAYVGNIDNKFTSGAYGGLGVFQ